MVGLTGLCVGGSAATATPSPTPPPSAIGAETPSWIQVAPNYQVTGLVVAVASPTGSCTSNCVHLWVSHDGGATWHRAKASGLNGGRPVIAVDSRGHDVLYSASNSSMVRSDDGGENWVPVGAAGTPSVSPTYASDNTVAVAVSGGGDYTLDGRGSTPVPGSGGSLYDMSYAYAPGYPNSGKYAPILLTGEDKGQRLPVIQQCSARYACSGSATLAGAVVFSSPVTLLPSNGYAGDGAVYAQSGRGIYKSTDGGGTFAAIPLGDPSATATATPMMALAPGYKEAGPTRTAWVSVFQIFEDKKDARNSRSGGGIYRTDDAGTTWHVMGAPGPFDGGAVAVAVGADGRLFGGYIGLNGRGGLLCSLDGGTSWNVACPALGSAANDPGLAAGAHPAICGNCVANASPAASPNGAGSGASATTTASSTDAGAAAGTAGASRDLAQATAHRSSTPPWGWIVAGGLAAAIMGLAAARGLRRRASLQEETPPGD